MDRTNTRTNLFLGAALASVILAGCGPKPESANGDTPPVVPPKKGDVSAAPTKFDGEFTSIENSTSVDVNYEQKAGPADAQLEGDPADVAQIVLTNRNGTLLIETKPDAQIRGQVTVRAHSANLESVTVSGSGNAKLNHLASDQLQMQFDGSGHIAADGAVKSVNIDLNGSGNIDIDAVKAEDLDASISGSGGIDSKPSHAAKVNIGGSGSAHVGSPQTLDVEIDGSGTVHYSGSPKIQQTINGSGGVVQE